MSRLLVGVIVTVFLTVCLGVSVKVMRGQTVIFSLTTGFVTTVPPVITMDVMLPPDLKK